MIKAIMVDQFGGPDVMQWRDVELPALGSGMARVRHTAVGLNFIDTYHRSGLYPLDLPAGLGTEAAGVVEAVGDDVETVAVGDRVAFVGVPPGTYCEQRIYAAERLVRLPDGISDQTAAAAMLKGLTAWYLVRRSYPVQSGDTVLLYAAAPDSVHVSSVSSARSTRLSSPVRTAAPRSFAAMMHRLWIRSAT